MNVFRLLLSCIFLVTFTVVQAAEPIGIASRRELLVDHALIDSFSWLWALL